MSEHDVDQETGEILDYSGLPPEQLMALWHQAKLALEPFKKMAEEEMALRKLVAAAFFPEPVEGANTSALNGGWTLKLTYKIDRKLDEAAMPAVYAKLREMGINPDPLVRFKPELETKAYKGLAKINEAAAKVMDAALVIKPGSPTLELVPPKGQPIPTQGKENT